MFHVGKITHVISPANKGTISADTSVQAAIRMWDDNHLILGVDKKIAEKIKKGQYVIADYSPVADLSMNRRMIIVKILPNEEGEQMWKEFVAEHEKRKSQAGSMPLMPPIQTEQERYIR